MLKSVAKSVFTANCNKSNFFRYWIEVTVPFHHLTGKESDLAAAFLKERHILSKSILDEEYLDRMLMTEEIQDKVRLSVGGPVEMTKQHFLVLKSKLKTKGFFDEKGKITPRLIPKIGADTSQFLAVVVFNIKDSIDETI